MTSDKDASVGDQAAVGAVVFGLVSLGLCWWFPFGTVVGVAGTALGILGWWTSRDGKLALVGTVLAAIGAGSGLLLAGSYWQRYFAL